MKNILLFGAGRSSSSLIRYLLDNAVKYNWHLTVGDASQDLAILRTGNHPRSRAVAIRVEDDVLRKKFIGEADIVISLLPPALHYIVALDCLQLKKNMVTASYVSPELRALHGEVEKSGLTFLNEMGLDPGIDHMSAMKTINEIRAAGGNLISFKSYCGGLPASESNDNPWGYKFTWNPRNVVMAGRGTACYIEDSGYRYVPYNRLFLETEEVKVNGCGTFEAYANRDSLSYRGQYGLQHIPTMRRGTLRMPGFCRAWNVFVKLGWTDDSFIIQDSGQMTWASFLEAFLPNSSPGVTLEKRLSDFAGEDEDSDVMLKMKWLDIYSDEKTAVPSASPASLLQNMLEKKWVFKESDRDMIVMQHEFVYMLGKERISIVSSLVSGGENAVHTAMSRTVGLPLGIGAKLLLENRIGLKGVIIPVSKEIYTPVLEELKYFGIVFSEKKSSA